MKKLQIYFSMALFVLCIWGEATVGQAATNKLDIRLGEWENVTVMNGQPSTKQTICISEDKLVIKEEEGDKYCKTNNKVVGNKVFMTQVCTYPPEMGIKTDIQMETTYSRESSKGTINWKTTDKSGKTTVKTGTFAGRRIGECKDSDKRPSR